VYDSDEDEERNLTDEILTRIPIISDKQLKMSDASWNSRGNVFYATSHAEQHLGPCNHNAFFYYFKFISFAQTINPSQVEKNYLELGVTIKI
jgi:hypothetical protein